MHTLETTPISSFWRCKYPRRVFMQTLLFPMPLTPKVQPLFMGNHRNPVLTHILSTLYLARLQDHRWTLVDRESTLVYKAILGLQYSQSAADELKKKKKKRKREGGDSDIEPGIYQNLVVIEPSLYLIFVCIRITKISKTIATC